MTNPISPNTTTVDTTAISRDRVPSPPSPTRGPRGRSGGGSAPATGWAASGPTDQGWKTGASALSASHSWVIAASLPLSVSAPIAALTQAVTGLPLSSSTL